MSRCAGDCHAPDCRPLISFDSPDWLPCLSCRVSPAALLWLVVLDPEASVAAGLGRCYDTSLL
jgi:hypothetical protein